MDIKQGSAAVVATALNAFWVGYWVSISVPSLTITVEYPSGEILTAPGKWSWFLGTVVILTKRVYCMASGNNISMIQTNKSPCYK